MKITKEVHQMYEEWQSMPQELKDKLHMGCLVGKYHFHFKNKNGEIGLVLIECGVNFTKSGKWKTGKMWEACGIMEYRRFRTFAQAKKEIFKALKEKIPNN